MDISNTKIKQEEEEETYVNNVVFGSISISVLKEELKTESEVFQNYINNPFTDYNDLVLEAPKICTKCDQIFPNSFTYLQHNLIHLQVKVSKLCWMLCQRCPKKYLNRTALENHIQTTHLKLKPQQKLKECDVCHKIFSKSYWYAHKGVHDIGNFTCDICQHVFKSKVILKRHLRTAHEKCVTKKKSKQYNIKDFKCDKCPKLFSSNDCLRHHVRNCHILMEVKCDLCDARFKNIPYLGVHLRRVHYDDGNSYPCDICGKIFKAPRRVRIHKKNVHACRRMAMQIKFENGSMLSKKEL